MIECAATYLVLALGVGAFLVYLAIEGIKHNPMKEEGKKISGFYEINY